MLKVTLISILQAIVIALYSLRSRFPTKIAMTAWLP